MTANEQSPETVARAVAEVARDWQPAKAMMALRAAGLGPGGDTAESLEAIAAEFSVSRETVRRARIELMRALQPEPAHALRAASSPAIARALRRLLTMTGPLAWDEVLAAWARAGGKHPYAPLPTDTTSLRTWAEDSGGFVLSEGERATVAVASPEALDQVSEFLRQTLRGQPGGVERTTILEAAEAALLRQTTVATALSSHPAVTRLARGTWALRGQAHADESSRPLPRSRPTRLTRPTSFGWARNGSLSIEFSMPRGPSPVIAVPTAISSLVEGREFAIGHGPKPVRLSVGNARLWGFGSLASELGISGGERAEILINLLTGTATLNPARGRETQG